LWGLATDGEEGALRVLEMLKAEFDLAMALSGAKNIAGIDRSLLG
jgi:4-hydroxymandelate oxidase